MDPFPILLTLVILTMTVFALPSNGNDCQTLMSTKSALGITSIRQPLLYHSWNSSMNCCKWHGVNCNNRQDRVLSLNLSSVGLTGTMPPSLANLTFLQMLDLSKNELQGTIPSELGSLEGLQILYLNNNSLQGEVPETLGRLTKLQEIDLAMNKLEGVIPIALFNCTKLTFLSVRDNKLTGDIPPSIGNLSMLIYLRLGLNNFGGVIPKDLARLTKAWRLDLMFNQLSGEVPIELYNSSSLVALELAGNMLSGTLPMDFGNHLPLLEALYLYDNRFEGVIPPSITNASALVMLILSSNRFVGVIPSNLGKLVNLTQLYLSDNLLKASVPMEWSFIASLSECVSLKKIDLTNNRFSGSLPDSIGNLSSSLEWLRLRYNKITGNIPPSIGNLSGLVDLDIENNHISGPIPDTLGKLLNMNALILRFNMLSGEIPPSLGNLANMSELYLNNNNLSGSIPETFASLQKLDVFDISYNSLNNAIPKSVLGISSLSNYLNLSHNAFSGSLPEEVGKLRNLKALDISHNRLFGEIPPNLGDCQLLDYLNLQGNNFNGTVPEQLSNLRGIQFLDLSQNQLHGHVPKFLEKLPFLQFLNLSFNNFEGEVPTGGIFGNLSLFSITGNINLCGGNLELNLRSCSAKRKGLSRMIMEIIIVVSAIILLGVLLLLFLLSKYFPLKTPKYLSEEKDIWNYKFLKLSYADLKNATDGFSASNLIGIGGFGSVYRGVLNAAECVAVKVFNQQVVGASKSFLDECEVLKNIRHRNLVRILSACTTVDFSGNEFKALIYEFMSKGNLDALLHNEELPAGSLDLLRRFDIAIDVASGLDYLHNHIENSIVHCDLKPTNILLDNDMTARISDFGISRILSPDSELMTTGIRGTIGYIPPESAMGCPITTSWDVYSFGVLLLEIFTGKRPTEMEDGLTLRQYVEKSFPDHVAEILDGKLLTEEGGGMAEIVRECIIPVIWVGLLCSKEQPKERIGIEDALKRLEDAKHNLLAAMTTNEELERRQWDLNAESSLLHV